MIWKHDVVFGYKRTHQRKWWDFFCKGRNESFNNIRYKLFRRTKNTAFWSIVSNSIILVICYGKINIFTNSIFFKICLKYRTTLIHVHVTGSCHYQGVRDYWCIIRCSYDIFLAGVEWSFPRDEVSSSQPNGN